MAQAPPIPDLLTRADAVLPRGSATLSKRPRAFPGGVGGYVDGGHGPYLVLTDGRQLLDWIGALGAVTLGYGHEAIENAVTRFTFRGGPSFSLPHRLEVDVAEQLVDRIPFAEQIKFVKTGSEACSGAVAIARHVTGRDLVLVDDIGYHGWHDGFRSTALEAPGVPMAMKRLVQPFRYNDPDHLNTLLRNTCRDRVAAVMLEPARLVRPNPGYLDDLVTVAHEAGAMVIFDEMILGARHHMIGGSGLFHVQPDLAVYGKAFGAGYPLAFIAGPADLMRHSWPISGTYSGDAVALVACQEVLRTYEREPVVATLWHNGHRLWTVLEETGIVKCEGYPPHFRIKFLQHDQRLAMSFFVQACASDGVLFHPAIVNASAAMTDIHILKTIDAALTALLRLGAMDADDLSALVTEPYEDSARR